MDIIEHTIHTIYKNMFKADKSVYLPKLIPSDSTGIPDQNSVDMQSALFGGCPGAEFEKGNASMDLREIILEGVRNVSSADEILTKPFSGNYNVKMGIKIAGPRVPAEPGVDFDEDDFKVGPSPEQFELVKAFTGLKAFGNFRCSQACSGGSIVEPSGKFFSTINNIKINLEADIIVPDNDSDSITAKVINILVDKIKPEQITITILYSDGRLPVFDYTNLPADPVALNFYNAQKLINFPMVKEESLHRLVADELNSKLSLSLQEAIKPIEKEFNKYLAKLG